MVRATNAGGEAQCIQDLAVLDPLPDELQDKASQDRIFQELMDFPSVVRFFLIYIYIYIYIYI